jgi:hypothetical protein
LSLWVRNTKSPENRYTIDRWKYYTARFQSAPCVSISS